MPLPLIPTGPNATVDYVTMRMGCGGVWNPVVSAAFKAVCVAPCATGGFDSHPPPPLIRNLDQSSLLQAALSPDQDRDFSPMVLVL